MFMSSSIKKDNLLKHKKDSEYIPTNEDNYMSKPKGNESENDDLSDEEDFFQLRRFREDLRKRYNAPITSDSNSNSNSNSNPTPTLKRECKRMIKMKMAHGLANGGAKLANDIGHAFAKKF